MEAQNLNRWISGEVFNYVFKTGREDTQAEIHREDHTKIEAVAGVKPQQTEECPRLLVIRKARRKQEEVPH